MVKIWRVGTGIDEQKSCCVGGHSGGLLRVQLDKENEFVEARCGGT